MTLGEYILNYREKHDISQRQFARMTGLSNSYISMLEKGLNPSSGKPIIPTILNLLIVTAGKSLILYGFCVHLQLSRQNQSCTKVALSLNIINSVFNKMGVENRAREFDSPYFQDDF